MPDVPERHDSPFTRLLRYLRALARRFLDDDCLLHASALTYTSLLSLVPLLALMFAVLKGLGVQRRLEPLLLSRLSLSPEVIESILTYIDHTNVGTLGALGAVALVTTVLSVLGSIERSFNHIWRVREGRTWWRKATDYVSTVLLTPFLLLAAVALTSSMQEQALLHWVLQREYIGPAAMQALRLAPLGINAVAIGILYAVMPNRRPSLPALTCGAVVAGAVWQAVQWGYVALQIGVARYNAIYGAMAQLPVTLVWIYVSWAVVLAGAELAAVVELGPEAGDATASAGARWAIAVHLLLRAGECFRATGGAVDPRAVARALRVSGALVTETAAQLCQHGLLAAVDGARDTYVLARDPATIELAALAASFDESMPRGSDQRVSSLWNTMARARHTSLAPHTLADLLDGRQLQAEG